MGSALQFSGLSATASTAAANIDQCVNGATGNPPTKEPCVGSNAAAITVTGPTAGTYKNWVNGNANGTKSHWREGDFIAYRAEVSGVADGSHTLILHYSPVQGHKHAIDYLGSFDTTETTSPTPSAFNANQNNPCSDQVAAGLMLAADCTPSAPISSFAIPAANFAGANATNCGATGTFGGSQVAGSFKMWGLPGSAFTAVSYVSQNVSSGTGSCDTTVSVTFTSPALTANQSLVIAWGGHIASQLDWGVGNSASFINGSPYHMSLDTLDGLPLGSQDRSLATSAIFFTPSISTLVKDSSGTTVTSVAVGTTVHDTATLANAASNAGGTVVYSRFSNGTCASTAATTQTVTVANALVPNSSDFTPSTAGSYSYQAAYSGDGSDVSSSGACEPFTVTSVSPTIVTTVKDASGTAVTAPVPLGSSVHDTAVLSGGFSPITGTVTYSFFTNGTCASTASTTQTVTIGSANAVPDSSATGPLTAGSYSYKAHYSGDTNNQAADATCEPFTVAKASPTITTQASPTTGTSGVAIASVGDTATFVGTGANAPTGSVTFALFSNSTCTAAVTGVGGSGGITTTNGTSTASYSVAWTPPAAGTYHWTASYAGDGNNSAFNTACNDANEQIVIAKASPTITTNASPATGTAGVAITNLSDTATFHSTTTVPPTGSVTFAFYSDAGCATAVTGVGGTAAISTSGGVSTATYTTSWTPPSTGTYNWVASYAGDGNNNSFATTCGDSNEEITVAKASPTITTQASPTTGTSGVAIASVGDTATFGNTTTVAPTGSVSFALFSNNTCTAAVTGVSGSGPITTTGGTSTASYSASWTPPAAGTYYWKASYAGDGNNGAFTTTCGDAHEELVISPASPTITTNASPSTGTSGVAIANLSDTATFGNTTTVPPTGSVDFALYSDGSCLNAVAGVSGSGTISTTGGVSTASYSTSWTPPATGTYYWLASYAGDSNNNGFTTHCGDSHEEIGIVSASPTITTQASPTTGTSGVAIASLGDTATFNNTTTVAPTGSVTFSFFSDSTCSTAVAGVGGSAGIHTSGSTSTATYTTSWTPPAAGTYYWTASYAGDANNNGFTTSCRDANEEIVIGKASPSITTQASPTTGTSGVAIASVGDTANFTNTTTVAPTGSVTFSFFSEHTCTTAVAGVGGSGTISTTGGTSSASYSTSWTPPAAGTYYWMASYLGDANNNGFTTGCGDANEMLVVSPASPTITTNASPATGTSGVAIASLSDTATFHNTTTVAPTGSVTFSLYSDGSCLTPVTGVSGSGSISTTAGVSTATYSTSWTPPAAGTYSWIASYAGDSNNSGFTTTCGDANEELVVGLVSPTITTQASPTSGTSGVAIASVGDTATFVNTTTVAPTGSVTFSFFSEHTCTTAVAGVGGSGTITTTAGTSSASYSTSWTPPAAGTYYWKASYLGDANNNGFTTGCGDTNEMLVISPASPTITTNASPATGTSGVAIATLSDTATFHDTTTVAPTGSVSFALYSDGSCLTAVAGVSGSGTISTSGGVSTATYSTSWTPPAAGTYSWIASYAGDANNNAFTTKCGDSNEEITVGKAAPTITTQASPTTGTAGVAIASVGDTATFVNTTTVAPTGSVTFTFFSNSGCTVAVAGVGGSAAISTTAGTSTASYSTSWTPPAAGTYYWKASYAGDSNNSGFTTTCGDANEELVVGLVSPTITTQASPTSGTSGVHIASVGDTATFHGTTTVAPTGSVSFALYSENTCTTAVAGVGGSGAIHTSGGVSTASYSTSWTPPAAGTYYWVASYAGDTNNNSFTTGCGDDNEQIVIAKASPNITTQASPTTGTSGVAIASVGDTATFGDTTTVAPTGSVTFAFFSENTCHTAVAGVGGSGAISTTGGVSTASYSTSWTPPAAGTYYWTASYAGDANNNGFTTGCGDANEQLVIAKASPNITTQASPTTGTSGVAIASVGDTATFGSTTTVAPTGSVTFALFSEDTCHTSVAGVGGSGTISTTGGTSTASYSTSWTPPAAGTYYWSASYAGDANNNGFTTGCGDANEQLVIAKASPNITTQASPTTGTSGVAIASVGDTATFGNTTTVAPTGSVSFALFSEDSCTIAVDSVSGIGTISTTGGVSTATFSTSWTPPAAGTYYWVASYAGDANNNGFTTGCGDSNEQIVIAKASPNITTQAAPTTGTAGTAIAAVGDTATFGNTTTVAPTGSVSFALFSDATCLAPVTGVSGTGAISTTGGTSTATFSTSWTPTAAGTYFWIASYSGDANNNGFTTSCGDDNEQIVIAKASPAIATTIQITGTNPNSLGGTTFGDKATVTGFVPSIVGETVSFSLFGPYQNGVTPTCATATGEPVFTTTGTLDANGVATTSATYTPTAGGTFTWVATWAGDANNNGATEPCNMPTETSQVIAGGAQGVTTPIPVPPTGVSANWRAALELMLLGMALFAAALVRRRRYSA